MAPVPDAPWWKGARGEWYVVVQVVLFALVAFGPSTLPGLPDWGPTAALVGSVLGAALVLAGATLSVAGLLRLGPNLTPLPYPKDCSELVEAGAYAIVRHPIYSGLIIAAFGLGFWRHGWLTLVWAHRLVRVLRREVAPRRALARREVRGLSRVPAAREEAHPLGVLSRPYRCSRQPTGTRAVGHTSSRKHAPHAGRFAVQIARPWVIMS